MVGTETGVDPVGSRQPNQPGSKHVVDVEGFDVGVCVSRGVEVSVVVVVVTSLHPNQPGVLQVDVLDVVVILVKEVMAVVVVVLSKHPHQPGVSHVEVLVVTDVDVDVMAVLVVVISEPLLLKNFHN